MDPFLLLMIQVTGLIVWTMFAHYVADFLVQTSWMAEGKSKSWKPLVAHIAAYTFTITLMGAVPVFIYCGGWQAVILWTFYCIVNGLCHMVTDYFTSRASGKAFRAGNIRKFWAIIGLDQFIHVATFWITLLIMILTILPLL